MFRCDCCQEECLLVFPIENVGSTVKYDLLCDLCAALVDQVRDDDELYLTLVEKSIDVVSLAA